MTAPGLAGARDAEIRAALRDADMRVLVVVLAQLTGNRRWLGERFRPAHDINMFGDEAAGLSVAAQEEVREAAFAVLRELRDGQLQLPEPPPDHELAELMSVCMGEPVAEEYAPMLLEEMGFRSRDVEWRATDRISARLQRFRVLVIGAGISGLCVAIKLERLGIPYTVIEKNETVGGTWLENSYPDCGVDTPNHFYSYSFEPNHRWSGYFSKRDELYEYLESCADRYGVRDHIRFRTELTEATYDEDGRCWRVTLCTPDGGEETVVADVVVSAVGQLNRPKYPRLDGLDDFGGRCFHSSRWEHDAPIDGADVAVIGTGASAMQLVRTTARRARRLMVFQRSPQWAVPNPNYYRDVSDGKQWLLAHVPHYAAWYRFTLFWRFGDGLHPSLQIDPQWPHPERSLNPANDVMRGVLTEHIRTQLGDRQDLLDKVLPDYPPFGKRMLMDNHWFATMTRDNVDLVTDPVARVTPTALVTDDGTEYPADVIVLATGFETNRLLWPMRVHGRGGRSLAETWGEDDPRAYLGITVPGFPNFFCVYGPNTNLGHGGSIIFHTECQVNYITRCLVAMLEEGTVELECRRDVHDEYNERVDDAHARMVWTHPGMSNWYKNAKGRVVTNSPWRLIDYWEMTREPDLADFVTRL